MWRAAKFLLLKTSSMAIYTTFIDKESSIWKRKKKLVVNMMISPSQLVFCLFCFLMHAVLYACYSGPTSTACLCWRWKTWWSWVTNQTPNASSPTCSLWSTTCADTRCPWVGPVTSDLFSGWDPPAPPPQTFTWWWPPLWQQAGSNSCTSLMVGLGIVSVCACVCIS